MRRIALAITAAGLSAAIAAGCGGKSPGPVRGSLDLPRATAGPPDAGTSAGHGADAVATTQAPVLRLTGRVRPASARVSVAGAPAAVRVAGTGAFAADVSALRPGATSLRLSARAPDAAPWRAEVRVLRRAVPAQVRVPAHDRTPPLAWTRLEQSGTDAPAVLHLAPVLTRYPHEALRLETPRLRVTSVVQDADGGTGRIRVSILYVLHCPGRPPRRVTSYTPPSAVAGVRIAPGVRVPTRRARTVSLDLPARCAVDGEAYGEAIAAGGRESVTDPIRFAYRPR